MVTTYIHTLRLFNRDVRLYLISAALIGFTFLGIYAVLFNLYLLRLGYGPEFIGTVNGVSQLGFALFFTACRWIRPALGQPSHVNHGFMSDRDRTGVLTICRADRGEFSRSLVINYLLDRLDRCRLIFC